MTTERDRLAIELAEQVKQASAEQSPLIIQGSGSKAFYGRAAPSQCRPLDVTPYRGVISHEPTELVITAAAGTPLAEVEATLAEQGQMLPFEPPHFGPAATLGGTIACGLSGPRRPYAGSVRDFVLGARIINGRGEILRFGGQVMKNVAGYDLSRLMCGSLGTLGVLLEVSLKVLPRPLVERTVVQPADGRAAIERCNRWAGKPYPLSAAAWDGEALHVRLSGAANGVDAAIEAIGGDPLPDDRAAAFWETLREQRLPFFADERPLWRLSVPPATGPLELPGRTLPDRTPIDWGGAQRWLASDQPAEAIFAATRAFGGHATLFRGGDRQGQVFQPLAPALARLHQRLKTSLDPAGLFNPGRLYAEF